MTASSRGVWREELWNLFRPDKPAVANLAFSTTMGKGSDRKLPSRTDEVAEDGARHRPRARPSAQRAFRASASASRSVSHCCASPTTPGSPLTPAAQPLDFQAEVAVSMLSCATENFRLNARWGRVSRTPLAHCGDEALEAADRPPGVYGTDRPHDLTGFFDERHSEFGCN